MLTQNIQYGLQSGVPFTLAGLAYSITLITGRQSAVIDNTISGTMLYPDWVASAEITLGTSPQASSVELWVIPRLAATGNAVDVWPQYATAGDAALSMDGLNQKYSNFGLGASITVDAVSNRTYAIKPFSIASIFGGICPEKFAFFLTHNTFANLNASASGNVLWVTPVTYTLQ